MVHGPKNIANHWFMTILLQAKHAPPQINQKKQLAK